jgi:hypothetical protein
VVGAPATQRAKLSIMGDAQAFQGLGYVAWAKFGFENMLRATLIFL